MARAKSAVLSAADKKAVIADIKAKIIARKTDLKAINVASKNLNKQLGANVKLASAADKDLAKLTASLTAITAPQATASHA